MSTFPTQGVGPAATTGEAVAVGVDIGGRHVRVGAVTRAGRVVAARAADTPADDTTEQASARVVRLIETTLADAGGRRLVGIGVGASGPVDSVTGMINNPGTLPAWSGVNVLALLTGRFEVAVALENDADTAALGEHWMGAARGASRAYLVTVGTGIGTAALVDGRLLRGARGYHPEGGHCVVDPLGPPCYCGANGCWEALASGTAIARSAREVLTRHPSSVLRDGGGSATVDARRVAEAAAGGDPAGLAILDLAATNLAIGLVNVAAFFAPEVIVLGGGVMRSFALFEPTVRATLARHGMVRPPDGIRVVPAELGPDSGVVGAAYTVLSAPGPSPS